MPTIERKTTQQTETYLYRPVAKAPDAVPLAWVYPAPYNIALSSLGYLSLFRQMDENPAIHPVRIYTDTLSSHSPREFVLAGMSFSFEMDILGILDIFAAWQLPPYSKDRDENHPLLFAGGPVAMTNPEPCAEFFDFFVIGDGEEVLAEIVACYRRYRELDRTSLLRKLAVEVSGVYVPSLYEIDYETPDGPVKSITPKFADTPPVVQKRTTQTLDDFTIYSPILSNDTVFENRFLVEVMRGCAHRCRFCLASYSVLPARGPGLDPLIARIEEGLKYTNKLGLLGALVSNHPQFPELCDYLNTKEGVHVSSSSLRADTLTLSIAQMFKKGGQNQITIAVETGSDRLKRRINKNLKNEEVIRAAGFAAEAGLKGLKLYGMVGLPDEAEDDVVQLAQLMKDIKKAHPRLKLSLTVSSFVPKAATPFQWQPRLDNKTIEARQQLLKKALLKTADVRPTSPGWDFVQAVLSRGDRRLAPLLLRYHQLGGSKGALNRAYKELKGEGLALPALDHYANAVRPEAETLPWDALHLGVDKAILYKEGLPPSGWLDICKGSG